MVRQCSFAPGLAPRAIATHQASATPTHVFRDSPVPDPHASTALPGVAECAVMHSNGEWDSVLCVDSLVAIPARCLCALANASATFADDLEALEARAEAEVHLAPTSSRGTNPIKLRYHPNSGPIPSPIPSPIRSPPPLII